jgi:hypothetical protein
MKEYFIYRNNRCFDRILDYIITGELSTEGLIGYDSDCLYHTLNYFSIPFCEMTEMTRSVDFKTNLILR